MKTIALYPGSFNPFHKGHLNILKKSESIFGEGNVVVCFGVNPDKIKSENKDEYVTQLAQKCYDIEKKIGSKVEVYKGFLHQYIAEWEEQGYNVVVVRGLRNGDDLDYEVNQMRFVNDFKKGVNVVYITCDKEFEHISSSAIRKISEFGGDEMAKNYIV